MKFKTDENLPVEVADLLQQHGHDAQSVVLQQLAGRPDLDVIHVCQTEQRALVTLDLDFSDIRAYPPDDYSGIIVLRPRSQTISSILRATDNVLRLLNVEPLSRHLWIVEDHRVRIRGGSGQGVGP